MYFLILNFTRKMHHQSTKADTHRSQYTLNFTILFIYLYYKFKSLKMHKDNQRMMQSK